MSTKKKLPKTDAKTEAEELGIIHRPGTLGQLVTGKALSGDDLDIAGEQLLDAVLNGDSADVEQAIASGAPLDYAMPDTGATALHLAASIASRGAIRALLRAEENLSFCVRDHEGRFPSEIAYLYGRDVAMARLLARKEKKEARAAGRQLTRRPQRRQ
ncbi:MAG: hypothetical protein R3E82_11570 [Pseudomonadales bacterium]